MARKRHSAKENKPSILNQLVLLGILLFLLGTISHTQIFYNSLIAQQENPRKENVSYTPASISIPSAKISVSIDEGGIVNGNWILSDKNALYLPTSGKIGEGYNTIIYAHNTQILFGNLTSINRDDIIVLKDRSGKKFTYKVFSKEDVDPQDLRKLYSTEKNIVTLFTCDGWFDNKRLLIKARLIAEKN